MFPTHSWDHHEFIYRKGSNPHGLALQHLAQRAVRQIFPDKQIITNYRHKDIVSDRGYPLEVDIYLPDLNLGFEYQVW